MLRTHTKNSYGAKHFGDLTLKAIIYDDRRVRGQLRGEISLWTKPKVISPARGSGSGSPVRETEGAEIDSFRQVTFYSEMFYNKRICIESF